ncbi:Sulfotransferase domain-containing protein [Psychroflexus salarius]|uniref:Sulfotransferase domain-containing protein n=2 Tax=Psychroflexus salarius TaxID=1155689 RepID=A0A1M4UU83_9FLAO|nr:Sulfotransferase domain-containing protein [Psychroflexus salarius]
MMMNKPNTFLIGVQKAATTSIYNWLSQHPEVCAPIAMKDISFFTRPMFYKEKGIDYLLKHYENCQEDQKIKLQGSVHYIFFEDALKRIKLFNPDAKFVLILRQPMERAISSFLYARKFNYEKLNFEDALEAEKDRMLTDDLKIKSECTYINHGFYASQINRFLKHFSKDQLKVILYDDLKTEPEKTIKGIFKFLSINSNFTPVFNKHNKTGSVKSKFLQSFLLGENKIKKTIVNKILPYVLSEEKKAKIRWKIIHLNTSNKKEDIVINQDVVEKYNALFKDDILELEKLLNRDLSNWIKAPKIN